jgi:predicted ATP-dependent endonuclease of OLD family
MHIKTFRVRNFRRLRDVRIDLDHETSVFVGANNSGKTSATHVFQVFLGKARGEFQIYDFSVSSWSTFDGLSPTEADPDAKLPRIGLDIWLDVDTRNAHRVVDLLPNLDWDGEPVGVRLEYVARDGLELLRRYAEAKAASSEQNGAGSENWKPWPQSLTNYLSRKLRTEYEIRYSVLDAKRCDADLIPADGYTPTPLGTVESGAAKLIDSLIRVDFLNAQRYLSDKDASGGRDEELSKRLSRFYQRNLDQREQDIAALSAVADSEAQLNDHFADVFKPTLDRLAQLGYPGFSNPDLVVKASLDAGSILNGSARVFYALPGGDSAKTAVTLPDQYNGLGFKNLIYMVVEILDFHHAWIDADGERPPIHLVMIEEPEVHLHAQLQQVFIRKVREILPEVSAEFRTQLVVTTHSAHIIYEREFQHIRYFKRGTQPDEVQQSDVRNLSVFYDEEETVTRDFLLQYLKLTHCDLFFADGAVLVEGNVERLLLPLIIERECPELRACHLTVLEVGGAFAHKFDKLVEFLGLPTLVITDLDSVCRAPGSTGKAKACLTTADGAVTANQTLKQWIPALETIPDLLNLDEDAKCPAGPEGATGLVRVAYEIRETATWKGASEALAGRTFEEAFALRNLEWSQHVDRRALGLRVAKADDLDLAGLHAAVFDRVRDFDKTAFALGLIAAPTDWVVPRYITEGLAWLASVLLVDSSAAEVAEVPETIDLPVEV